MQLSSSPRGMQGLAPYVNQVIRPAPASESGPINSMHICGFNAVLDVLETAVNMELMLNC